MKKIFFVAFASLAMATCANASVKGVQSSSAEPSSEKKSLVINISQADYKSMIEDYSTKEWDYKGQLPAVVDFYADWCGPCRRLSPIMEEVAAEFEGKVKFYKVNVDNASALARAYGVSSIPMVLFIPADGKPATNLGLVSKEAFVKLVKENCFKK